MRVGHRHMDVALAQMARLEERDCYGIRSRHHVILGVGPVTKRDVPGYSLLRWNGYVTLLPSTGIFVKQSKFSIII